MRHTGEAISASPDIARNLLARGDGTLEGLKGQHITEAARDGDPVALAAFNTMASYLGAGIASLCAVIEAGELKGRSTSFKKFGLYSGPFCTVSS
jgi:glucokinase